MNANTLHTVVLRPFDHRFQMVDMRMNIAIREESEKMKRGMMLFHIFHKFVPGIGRENLAARDRLRDEFRSLRENLTRAEGVVSDLGVAHIVIGGKPDGGTVRLDLQRGIGRHQTVKRRRVRHRHGVGGVRRCKPDAIHDNGEQRTLNSRKL